jgi:hypothetical protein
MEKGCRNVARLPKAGAAGNLVLQKLRNEIICIHKMMGENIIIIIIFIFIFI